MNSFLIQVGFDKNANIDSYVNVMDNRRYVNPRWSHKRRDKHHGMVEAGDRLLVYCTSKVFNEDHKRSIAFSVDVRSVSADRTTFELGEPQLFQNPLKRMAIREFMKQGELDNIFRYCGAQGFNIIKLEPIAEKQIFDLVGHSDLVEPPKPSSSAPTSNRLHRGQRAVREAVRHLRRRFQRRDRGGEA